MIDFTAVKLQNIATHFIGNKLRDEGIKISSGEVNIIEEDTKKYLLKYFLSSFQDNEKFNFSAKYFLFFLNNRAKKNTFWYYIKIVCG